MAKRQVFISYSSAQGDWVWDRLVPCLKAGGAQVLIDRERFTGGKALLPQMDDLQDKASRHLLILSPAYLASPYCLHEMKRAIALDPHFQRQVILPVKREDCPLPPAIAKPNPLHVDLRNDKTPLPWTNLMQFCATDLGTDASAWLSTRDDIRRFLRRRESVNLVVTGKPKWNELIDNLSSEDDPKGPIAPVATVDLQRPACASRRGLVEQIIRALGGTTTVPPEPEDLVTLDRFITDLPSRPCIALLHFDYAAKRDGYGVDFWAALRDLATTRKKVVLLIQSRASVPTLVPQNHPMSSGFTSLQTVELKALP